MTLGRSSSGAIKIKTDGGLRAVNCECCGGQCPETLRVTFEGYQIDCLFNGSQHVGEACFGSVQPITQNILCEGSVTYSYSYHEECVGVSLVVSLYCFEGNIRSFGIYYREVDGNVGNCEVCDGSGQHTGARAKIIEVGDGPYGNGSFPIGVPFDFEGRWEDSPLSPCGATYSTGNSTYSILIESV